MVTTVLDAYRAVRRGRAAAVPGDVHCLQAWPCSEPMAGNDGAPSLKEQLMQNLQEVGMALAARRVAEGDVLQRCWTGILGLRRLPQSSLSQPNSNSILSDKTVLIEILAPSPSQAQAAAAARCAPRFLP